MRITNDVIVEGTAKIDNLPMSSNSLSAVVQTDGNLYKRELGTISTASKESYIPGLSVSFPSIFNLNTESLDYNNRNLVVSLKNQLQGTVFMAPVSMNGTPQFRRMLKSDLADASVLFSDDPRIANWDTAYSRGDFRDYGLGNLLPSETTDLDNLNETQFNRFNAGTVNRPYDYGNIISMSRGGEKTQLVLPVQNDINKSIMYRGKVGNAWWRWVKVWDEKNLQNPATESWANSKFWNITDRTGYLPTSVTNLDMCTEGQRGLANARQNQPVSGYADIVTISQFNPGDLVQLGLPFRGNDNFSFRNKTGSNNAWSEWRTIYHSGNLTPYNLFQNRADLTNSRFYTSLSGIDANTIYGNVAFYTSSQTTGSNNYYHHQSWGLSENYSYQIRKAPTISGGLGIRTNNNGTWLPWENIAYESWVNNQGFKQTLSLIPNVSGGISISDGNSIALNSLMLMSRGDALNRNLRHSFTPYYTASGSVGYPEQIGAGIRIERFSTANSQLGFNIHKASRKDQLYYRTFDLENTDHPWKIIADRDWVSQNYNLQNYYTKTESVNQFVGISNTQTIGGTKTFSNSPVVPTATLATHAINKGQIESWVTAQIAQGADSILEYTTQGGVRIKDWNSFSFGNKALTLGFGSVTNVDYSTSLGSLLYTDGFASTNQGYSSSVRQGLSFNMGTYNMSDALMSGMSGTGLIVNTDGMTAVGRYNTPTLPNSIDSTVDKRYKLPVFVVGAGLNDVERRTILTGYADGRFDLENGYDDTNWNDNTLVTKKWVLANGGGSTGSTEDYVSSYGSQISVFAETKANISLRDSVLKASGEILHDVDVLSFTTPTVYYLGNDNKWRRWSDNTNAEFANVGSTAVLGLALDNKTILLRGYYYKTISTEMSNLMSKAEIFHSFNKGALYASPSTASVERVFGYKLKNNIGYFNPWMFKK